MWSGKTTALLSFAEKCKFQKKNVIAFKPQMDDRYSESEIMSHGGWKLQAHCVKSGNDIIKKLAQLDTIYDVIVVDEMFMINGIAETLIWAFRSGITVIVSTLDLSSTGKAFLEVKTLLPWATKVVKCTACCSVCGEDARYTYKKFSDTPEIHVGGDEIYEPRCAKHHPIFQDGEILPIEEVK